MVGSLVRKARRLALIGILIVSGMLMASCASVMEFLEADSPDFGSHQESQAGKRVPIPPTVQDLGAED
jgi:hypothetical protein